MTPSNYEALVQRVILDMHSCLLSDSIDTKNFIDNVYATESNKYIEIWERNFTDVVSSVVKIKESLK